MSNAASKTLNCHFARTTMVNIRTFVLNDWDFRTSLQFHECCDPCKQLCSATQGCMLPGGPTTETSDLRTYSMKLWNSLPRQAAIDSKHFKRLLETFYMCW